MPLVTAVMPTMESRNRFWDAAIRCFLSQTFEDSELLILSEGPAAGGYIHPRIRYAPGAPLGLKTGMKRNLVNSLANSEIIVHWDDDDWSHPERLAEQVKFLQMGYQLVGYHDLLYFRENDGSFWKYKFAGVPPYATGTSMCYRKDWWAAHRFPNVSVGEDTAFWRDAINVMASSGLSKMIVARAHDGNTFKIPFGQSPFTAAPRELFPQEFLDVTSTTGLAALMPGKQPSHE